MSIRYIDAEAVHAALPYPQLIDTLRHAFAVGAETPLRASYPVTPAGDRLLLMPAWRVGEALGVKIVTVFSGNAARGLASIAALYLLLDGATGQPRALLDGEALTLRRTAAASALASTYLSRTDSRTLLVVGTGALAAHMVAAHRAVRPIERVLVWGRTGKHASSLAQRVTGETIEDLADGLAQADIVTCATSARSAVIHGAQVPAGTHVDLVGAFTADMREADDALMLRAELFVDTYEGALHEAGDVVQPMKAGLLTRDHIRGELADLVCGRHAGRSASDTVTVFKSVGTALEDLAAAQLAFECATA
jgi:ornithine cyclodeaminase/alanine dehydrogenase-like protein (mu-crystallin family)